MVGNRVARLERHDAHATMFDQAWHSPGTLRDAMRLVRGPVKELLPVMLYLLLRAMDSKMPLTP
jgi:hypothetical protein